MENLDNLEEIKKIDTQSMYKSIEELGLQIKQAWQDASEVKIDYKANEINNILVAGMGGSALGARIIDALYVDRLSIPLKIYGNYGMPEFVNENTLVIASSYSGSTEESLETLDLAISRGAKIIGIASGSKLIEKAKENSLPYYLIKPDHNPCGQPRMAIGYSIVGQLAMLNTIGLISINLDELESAQSIIEKNNNLYGIEIAQKDNLAKQLAQKIKGHIPILIAADHLSGAIYASRNQFNENGKNYTDQHVLPELDHHLLESLGFPNTNKDNLFGIFLNSKLYHQRNQKRVDLTMDVMEKNNISTFKFTPSAKDKFSQVFESLHFFSYVNYYLALLNDVNPSPIPWVDYFKEKLA